MKNLPARLINKSFRLAICTQHTCVQAVVLLEEVLGGEGLEANVALPLLLRRRAQRRRGGRCRGWRWRRRRRRHRRGRRRGHRRQGPIGHVAASGPRRLTLHAEGVVVLGQPDLRRTFPSTARDSHDISGREILRRRRKCVFAFYFAERNRRLLKERGNATGRGRGGRAMLTTRRRRCFKVSRFPHKYSQSNPFRTCSLMWRTEWRMRPALVSKASAQTLQRW